MVAPAGASARWRRIAREAIVVGNPIAFADRSGDLTVLSLVGPRARRLLAAAGLTGYPADVRTAALAGVPVVLVREDADRFLLVVGDDDAETAWRGLGDAGAPLGLALVGQRRPGAARGRSARAGLSLDRPIQAER